MWQQRVAWKETQGAPADTSGWFKGWYSVFEVRPVRPPTGRHSSSFTSLLQHQALGNFLRSPPVVSSFVGIASLLAGCMASKVVPSNLSELAGSKGDSKLRTVGGCNPDV